jgi:aspartyl-tRNA(Asn)/glutamyl-tRNA(Gln) amidotransferase subunit A
VAFGFAAAGIGSDTGGSVRIPSAFNDLVGLKTTHGRLSNEGVVPLVDSLDTVGPLCRQRGGLRGAAGGHGGRRDGGPDGGEPEGARLLVLENYTRCDGVTFRVPPSPRPARSCRPRVP